MIKNKQLSFNDYANKETFFLNDDIATISQMIEREMEKTDLKQRVKQYTIWEHVPNLGYRLELIYARTYVWWELTVQEAISIMHKSIKECNFNEIYKFAESKNIELSIIVTPYDILFSTLEKGNKKR